MRTFDHHIDLDLAGSRRPVPSLLCPLPPFGRPDGPHMAQPGRDRPPERTRRPSVAGYRAQARGHRRGDDLDLFRRSRPAPDDHGARTGHAQTHPERPDRLRSPSKLPRRVRANNPAACPARDLESSAGLFSSWIGCRSLALTRGLSARSSASACRSRPAWYRIEDAIPRSSGRPSASRVRCRTCLPVRRHRDGSQPLLPHPR
jgi:uncharacterized protein YbaR (Trm112 family)